MTPIRVPAFPFRPARGLLLLTALVLPAGAAWAQPGTVTGLRATAGTGSVTLEWSGDSTGIGVWNVERSQAALGTTPTAGFRLVLQAGAGARAGTFPFRAVDSQLQPGHRYCYRIQPQRTDGSRLAATAPVCVDLPAPAPVLIQPIFQSPAHRIRRLAADPVQFQWLRVRWTASTSGTASYEIEREDRRVDPATGAEVVTAAYRLLATVPAAGAAAVADLQHDDRAVTPGNRYCYRVREVSTAGVRSTFTSPACSNLPQTAPPPAPLQILRPLGGQGFRVDQAIEIVWTVPPGVVRSTVLFERASPPSTTLVPGGPFPGDRASWTPRPYAAARGQGRIVVDGLDAAGRVVARGSVNVNLIDPAAGGGGPGGGSPGGGAVCGTESTLRYDFAGVRRSGWYTGSKTFTVELASGWRNRGIRFVVTPGDGLFQYTCTRPPRVTLRRLGSMGYPSDVENGKPQPNGPVIAETDDVGIDAFFKQDSGTIELVVDWPPGDWGSCNSRTTSSCFFLEMVPLPR